MLDSALHELDYGLYLGLNYGLNSIIVHSSSTLECSSYAV